MGRSLDFRAPMPIVPSLEGASVAQLAEQVIRNDQVDGSNPPAGSTILVNGV